jgi:DNA-binding winged helix-turn-helix (wHTH) protein/tetratricopeptide (TPR) repeat protein
LVYIFDSYQVDDKNISLTRDGQRLPLEPKAVQVLLLLVKNAGQLVRKEALRKAVWPNVVVEESSLSRAIALIRKQLGDDPRKPTYIETVPTLGFRFIGVVSEKRLQAPGEAIAKVKPAVAATAVPLASAKFRLRRQLLTWLMSGFGLCAVIGFSTWRAGHFPLPPKHAVVLAEFVNKTGDPLFNDTLRQGLIVQLAQSPYLHLLPEQRISQTLKLMGLMADARMSDTVSREVCQRTGSLAVLHGSIAPLGDHYVVALSATDCQSGELIHSDQLEVGSKNGVLGGLTEIARRVRGPLGESLASTSHYDLALAEATTPSLEALKAFSEAHRINNLEGPAAALPLVRHAIEIDPEFALAHALAARLYGDLGQEEQSVQSATAAYRFRERATERERFWIVASYEMQVSGNMLKALEACDTWGRVFPNDEASFGFRAGLIYREFGQYENALAAAKQTVELNPDLGIGYHLVAVNQIALGQLTEAHHALTEAMHRGIRVPLLSVDQYRLAFLENDHTAMSRIAGASTIDSTYVLLANQEAASFAYAGRFKASRGAEQRALLVASQAGQSESVSRLAAAAALREAFFGNIDEAANNAMVAMSHSNGRDTEYGAALAFALIGKIREAGDILSDLQRRFPDNTSVQQHYLPTIRAALALAEHDPGRAIDWLTPTQTVEMGSPNSAFTGYYGTLYPIFMRGRALLDLHRSMEASKEFDKIVEYKMLVANDPIGSIAYLELARAHREAGDTAGARKSYATLLRLWSGADNDLTLVKTATREFETLL